MLPDLIVLAVETGMRAGELTAVRWEDVDLPRLNLRLVTSKNGEGRYVPLSIKAVEVLEGMKKTGAVGLLFPTNTDSIGKSFSKVCREIGVTGLHFHDLRHEAVSRLAPKLHVLELASMVGHRDLKSLMTYYQPHPEELAKKLG